MTEVCFRADQRKWAGAKTTEATVLEALVLGAALSDKGFVLAGKVNTVVVG